MIIRSRLALFASTLLVFTACQPAPTTNQPASGTPVAKTTTPSAQPTPSPSPSKVKGNELEEPNTTPQETSPNPVPTEPAITESPKPKETPTPQPTPAPTTDLALGFTSKPHGFSFANGSGGNYDPKDPTTAFFTIKSMQKMFGDKNVCTGTTAGATCKPTPAAKKWQDKINKSMNDGQCEGMAVLALSLFAGVDKAEDLEPGKATAFEMAYSGKAKEMIGQYFAYQYTKPVVDGTIKGTPSEVVEKLKPYLQPGQKDPVTLGFYGDKGGHATTAYGLADKGNGIMHILMYDNNWPNQERYIEVDTKADTWIYNFAATNPTEAADAWKGDANTKTLEFTPLSTRLQQAPCPYCPKGTSSSSSRQVYLNAGTSGNAHIKIVDKNDPTKFIGWDPVKKAYVNNMTGASFVQSKSVLTKGDRPEAPVIQIPEGMAVDIKVDGKDLGTAEKVDIDIFGQGKAIKVSGIDLDPTQEDTLSLGSDGDSCNYAPGNSPDQESPEFEMAFDNPDGKDYSFKVKSLSANSGEHLGLDLEGGKLKVSDDGKDADPYDMEVDRYNDNGSEEVYSNDDVELGAGETDNINFENWAGQGEGMSVGPEGQETTEPDVDEDALD